MSKLSGIMHKKIRKISVDLVFYLACIAIAAAVLVAAKNPSDAALKVILTPYAKAVEVFYNIKMTYTNGIGYSAPGLAFAIGESCMGVNYMAVVFCMMACMFLHRFRRFWKLLWMLLWIPGAAAVSVVMTCLRIVGSVPIVSHPMFSTLHAGIGISFYLAGMGVCYMAANAIFRRGNTVMQRENTVLQREDETRAINLRGVE
jgi:exosortase K